MPYLLLVLFGFGSLMMGVITLKMIRLRQYTYLPAIAFLLIAFVFLALSQIPQQGGSFNDIVFTLYGVLMFFASLFSATLGWFIAKNKRKRHR